MEYFYQENELISRHSDDRHNVHHMHRISPQGYKLHRSHWQELGIQRQVPAPHRCNTKEWDACDIQDPEPDLDQLCYQRERYLQETDI